MPDKPRHCVVAIVPCNDIEASTAFYVRLGLSVHSDHGSYRILSDGGGWLLHLSVEIPKGWVVRGRNPNGLYLYLEDVDGLASRVADLTGGVGPEHKPWGMYEFALSDPDGTLVRIGWPSDSAVAPRQGRNLLAAAVEECAVADKEERAPSDA